MASICMFFFFTKQGLVTADPGIILNFSGRNKGLIVTKGGRAVGIVVEGYARPPWWWTKKHRNVSLPPSRLAKFNLYGDISELMRRMIIRL
jgi:hypothetical protein